MGNKAQLLCKNAYVSFYCFNESKDSDHITTISTCLDTKPLFFLNNIDFKNSTYILHI